MNPQENSESNAISELQSIVTEALVTVNSQAITNANEFSELQSIITPISQSNTFSDLQSIFTANSETTESDEFSEQSLYSPSESESQSSQNSENSQDIGEKTCEFEMIQGKRRDKMILHSITEHQLYVRNKVLANGSVAYTCEEKNCKARLYVKNGVCSFSEPFYGHLHGNKEKKITELKLLAQIKEQCAKPTGSQTTSQISENREIFDDAVLG